MFHKSALSLSSGLWPLCYPVPSTAPICRVEELDRVALCAAPVERGIAAELVAEAAVDDPHGVVSDTLVALSRLALAYPKIASIDVNPLIIGESETVAVDALVVCD